MGILLLDSAAAQLFGDIVRARAEANFWVIYCVVCLNVKLLLQKFSFFHS
jgi:hypothetical protein